MLLAVLVLQLIIALLLLALWMRKPVAATPVDARLLNLPDGMVSLAAKVDASDGALRNHVSELRREQGEAATQARQAAVVAHRELREEISGSINTLGKTLHDGLSGFRTDNAGSAEALRTAVHRELTGIGERLTTFSNDSSKHAREAQEALHRSLSELRTTNTASHDALREGVQQRLATLGERNESSHRELREGVQQRLEALGKDQQGHQERLRTSMEGRLDKLNADNASKLEQMRVTVDEKLQSTLNERLTQSFGQVTTHLGEVQKGLGEMKDLATGVSDLKRVFSNVKSRGIIGEFQLGMQLEQMFSREQYDVNCAVKPNSGERVEYALKIPDGDKGHVWLAIDAKFPREDWEKLEHSYEHGTKEEQDRAGAAFERAIRTEGKRICEKYINPPTTLPFAVMFLPTEALYAEVMRRPGLHTELQSSCNVTVAGPSSFMAILTSFQMGFRTLAIQQKGNEVWNVLGNVKTEFGKFETLMTKVEGNVERVQTTLRDIGVRTRAINRNLRNVSELTATAAEASVPPFDSAGMVLMMAAGEQNADDEA